MSHSEEIKEIGNLIDNITKKTFIKCPLNYVGGKSKLLPQILPLFPKNINTFVDLFCGGCNVGINVNANRVIFNDLQKQLIDLYQKWFEDGYERTVDYIEKRIEEFQLSKTNKDGYIALRNEYNTNFDIRDLFVLVAYAFNNQIRFNSKGQFNMPFGKDRSSFNDKMKNNLENFIRKILEQDRKIFFTNKPFNEINLDKLGSEDFVYADPPYLITTAIYNENGGWSEENEYSLLELLDNCTKRGIKFALSNVLENKGKENTILKEWINKNSYNVYHLNNTYGNCNYHAVDKSSNTTDEVLITNY